MVIVGECGLLDNKVAHFSSMVNECPVEMKGAFYFPSHLHGTGPVWMGGGGGGGGAGVRAGDK
jgi:hypothetical protein